MSLMKYVNPFMKWLLRSPFHGLVSSKYMILGFTGRKSGQAYATPVQYVRQDKTVYFITDSRRVWWKNLRDDAPVTLTLRGQTLQGSAQATADPDAVRPLMTTVYPTMPQDYIDQNIDHMAAVIITLS